MKNKLPIDEIVFRTEFKKWLYQEMNYVSNIFSFSAVCKIVRKFYKENSDRQFAGMRKDTDMWIRREKLLDAEIEELQSKNAKLKATIKQLQSEYMAMRTLCQNNEFKKEK